VVGSAKGYGLLLRLILRGALTGLLVSIAISLVPTVILIADYLADLVTSRIGPAMANTAWNTTWRFATVASLFLLLVTALPALVGAVVNAACLFFLAKRHALTLGRGALVGVVVGLLAGAAAIRMVYSDPTSYFGVLTQRDLPFVLVTEGIAALAGCWHAWRLVSYLRRDG
jgi:hypothetical protein